MLVEAMGEMFIDSRKSDIEARLMQINTQIQIMSNEMAEYTQNLIGETYGSQNDDMASVIAEFQANYTLKEAEINSKELKLNTEKDQLETEYKALDTQKDWITKSKKDSIKSNFGYFK